MGDNESTPYTPSEYQQNVHQESTPETIAEPQAPGHPSQTEVTSPSLQNAHENANKTQAANTVSEKAEEYAEETQIPVEEALEKVHVGNFEGEPEMSEVTRRIQSPRKAARFIVGKYRDWALQERFDTDDLEQEALLAMWEADQKIDEMQSNGTWVGRYPDDPARSERNFLYQAMRFRMLAILDRNRKHQRDDSLEELVEESGDRLPVAVDTEARAINSVLTNEYLRVATTELLDDRERTILEGILQGKNTREIAHIVGMAEGSVSNATSNIVVKLRDYFGVDPTLPIHVFREREVVQDEGLRRRAQEAGVSVSQQYQKEYYEARKAVLQERARARQREKRAAKAQDAENWVILNKQD